MNFRYRVLIWMSNIKDILYAEIQHCRTWYQLDGRHVVQRCGWAHAPVIHADSHHEKGVARVSISTHAGDPVPIVMGLRYN